VQLQRLWLTDFRSYPSAELSFAPGLTALLGDNGEGKTNVMEAVAYLATLSSFRGAPNEALVRHGCSTAVVRAEGEREGRSLLVEAEITTSGRGRVQVNKQRLSRARDLLGALRVSVFSPDDLELVKGGPAERRRYLDDTLVARQPKLDVVRSDLDRVLRQRNALLRQSGGRVTPEVEATLAVWDIKLVEAGEALADARAGLVEDLAPVLAEAYDQVAGRPAHVRVAYQAPWREQGLAAALEAARTDELRRGVSLVGPHRDELVLTLDDMPARTHASQVEQRSVALALRLAAHRVVTDATGSPPILLLDDVFSELDPDRGAALLAHLPPGQTLLSSASGLPPGAEPELVLRVDAGAVTVSTEPLS
jgi:DNA replication and repair protein RecF